MAKTRRLLALEQEWMRRYGEPPPIVADAPLLARILRESGGGRR